MVELQPVGAENPDKYDAMHNEKPQGATSTSQVALS